MEKAKFVSESRILSESDFRMIRAHQLRKQIGAKNKAGKKNLKRTNDELLLDEEIQEKFARFAFFTFKQYQVMFIINYFF